MIVVVVVVVGLLGKMTEDLMAESAMSRQPDVGAGPSARTPYFVFNCGERGCDPLAARGDQSQNAGALPTWRSLPPHLLRPTREPQEGASQHHQEGAF